MKGKLFAVTGIIPLAIAALFVLTLLSGQPVAVLGETLGFTPTFTPLPTDTPSATNTATNTPTNTPTGTPEESGTPVPLPTTAPEAHLLITKSANPTEVLPGGQVVFTIQVCNDGNSTAASVIVSDGLPPELTLLSASASQGRVIVEGNGMRAELGALLAGECASVTITAQVRTDIAPGTRIRNVGSVGDTYDDATITVVGLLPESGGIVPLAAAAALVLMLVGVGLSAVSRRWTR